MVTVHKFGGGVLKDAKGFQRAANILKGYGAGQVAVVSAVYGVTDRFESLLEKILGDGKQVDEFCRSVLQDHLFIVGALQDQQSQRETAKKLTDEIARLNKILYGVHLLQELTPRTTDLALSFGERLSAVLLEAFLKDAGVNAKAFMADEAGMVTTNDFGNALPLMDACGENLRKTVLPSAEEGVAVFTGYFGKSTEGHVTTFGRGGSDYSAGILANALDAEKLLVWKDVEGFMSADPKVVPTARFIPLLSYDEAEELGSFGARILHPKTMSPLREKNIPVQIRNVFQPDKEGTVISSEGKKTESIAKSIAVKKNACLVAIKGGTMLGVASITYPLFEELRKHDLPIDVISTSQSDLSLCFEKKYLPAFRQALGKANVLVEDVTVDEQVSLLGLVGEGMNHTIGVSGRFFSALAKASVNIRMISQGASEINITVAITRDDVDKALNAVHAEFIG